MSGTYSFLNCGACLGDVVPDSSLLDVDTSRDIELGAVVAVVIKADGPFAGLGRRLGGDGYLGVTKIFLGTQQSDSGETVFLFGQLSPPLVAPVPRSALEAMHLVIGGQAAEGSSDVMSADDNAAMELLSPFFRACAALPSINPTWRPPEGNRL